MAIPPDDPFIRTIARQLEVAGALRGPMAKHFLEGFNEEYQRQYEAYRKRRKKRSRARWKKILGR